MIIVTGRAARIAFKKAKALPVIKSVLGEQEKYEIHKREQAAKMLRERNLKIVECVTSGMKPGDVAMLLDVSRQTITHVMGHWRRGLV